MEKRLNPISALAGAIGALVVSLSFGSETFVREVVIKPVSRGNTGAVTEVLATPSYSKYFLGPASGTAEKWSFIVVFSVAVALLVLATARRGTGFVAGWTATIAAGAIAGFVRGTLVNDTYGYTGSGRGALRTSFQFAGQGANYGLLIGWGVGLLVLFGSLIGGRSGAPAGPPAGAPAGGWPAGPGGANGPGGADPSAPRSWSGRPLEGDAPAPAPPPPPPAAVRPVTPSEPGPTADQDATTVSPDPSRADPSGWSRPSDGS